jgi:flagellar protein FliO/FliZ
VSDRSGGRRAEHGSRPGQAPAAASGSWRQVFDFCRRFSILCLLTIWICTPLGSAEPATAASATDPVIVPRATAGGEPATAGRTGSNPLLLLLALGAAAAGGWLLWRQRRSPAGLGGRDARRLAVVETRGLGNRQYLVVADYDGRKFLLGVCPGRIELLSRLDGGSAESE